MCTLPSHPPPFHLRSPARVGGTTPPAIAEHRAAVIGFALLLAPNYQPWTPVSSRLALCPMAIRPVPASSQNTTVTVQVNWMRLGLREILDTSCLHIKFVLNKLGKKARKPPTSHHTALVSCDLDSCALVLSRSTCSRLAHAVVSELHRVFNITRPHGC
jgi:hypothetical protein